ncbi:ABC transporter permease [Actinotalea sp. K2]|uniref:ABC transporter permease n=1 Tax=Actinotalea sp. K2 TaxID=2939438 RepID=UPI0020177FFB|nr:ABC transporter permease [Actinotalea sp. K2]MCL3859622.1 ABC transporter permease [Actinotalea sp. K2]
MPATEPVATPGPAAAGPGDDVIHDIGFRHYDGPRLGRAWVVRSLLVETVRGCFGLGRPARSKVMPWSLIGILLIPPLIIALSILLIGGDELPVTYTQYPNALQLVVSLFVAGAAPYCVSRDLRHGVMPLYLSRPMMRTDYVLAKFAGLALAVLGVLALAQTLLLIGALLAKLPVGAQLVGWASGLLVSVVLAVLLSAITLVVAAFTPRRGFGVAAIITILVVVSGVAEMLTAVAQDRGLTTAAAYLPALDPFNLVDGIAVRLLGAESARGHDVPPGVLGGLTFLVVTAAVVAGCLALLIRRYRKVGVV